MLNEISRRSCDVTAQAALLKHFKEGLVRDSFDTSLLSPQLRTLYETPQAVGYEMARAYCKSAGCLSHIGSIAIDYYADTEFNAGAAPSDGTHVIGLSAGVPMLLMALFFDVLRSTNPLAIDYEDPNADVIAPGDYRFPDRLAHEPRPAPADVARLIEETIRDTVPDARWQRVWSATLADLATAFVFAHELGHIIRGHTAVKLERGQKELLEVASSYPAKSRRLRRLGQVWEIEADETAFAFLWSYAINTRVNRRRFAHRLRCINRQYPIVTLASRLIYAVSFVFFLIGQAQRRVNSTGTHPSALVRITYILAMAQTALEQLVPAAPPAQLEIEIQNAHSQAEAAWNRLGLEFGVGSYQKTIDDLPVAINRIDRRRDRSSSILTRFAWRRKPGG